MYRIIVLSWALLATTFLSAGDAFFFGPERLSSSLITAVVQTDDGLLWVGTSNGLNRFDGYRFTQTTSIDEQGRPFEVSVLYADEDGRLWVGTARGLLLHDRVSDRLLPIAFPDSLQPRITTLGSQPDGRIVAGTAGYGYFIIDSVSLTATPRTGTIPSGEEAFVVEQKVMPRLLPLAPKGVVLTCSVEDDKGNIYIGTRGDGLFWIPAGEHTMQRRSVAVSGLDLNRARVASLFIDRMGNLWVGCQQKGLLMIPLQRMPLFSTWSFAEQRQETGTCVAAIAAAAPNQTVWCAVQGDGIYGFATDGSIMAHPAAPQGVETLMCDAHGHYWLGTTDALWSYEPTTGRATLKARFECERVNVIKEMSDGRLAVSTFGAGVSIVQKETGAVLKRLTMNDTDTVGRGGLINDWVFSLDTDRRGRLWIGTSSGVFCYNPEKDSFTTQGWGLLVEREQCTALCVLASDQVLIASEHGLFRWSAEQGLQAETGTEALRGKTVSFMIEDSEGDVWMSTNDGIWQWNPREQVLVAYAGELGLHEREFVQGAGLKTADGRLFFGTADGITSFVPAEIRHSQPADAKVHLTAFVIAGTSANALTLSNGRAVMDGPVSDCRHFSLSYMDAIFRLEFSLLDFATAEGVAFEYRLDNDERWQQTSKGDNAIVFSHLAPGTYNLEVRALLGGAYTPTETYIIEVRPPWWRSTIAYLLYTLLLLGGAVMVALAYRRHIQHQLDQEKLHFLMNTINTQDTPLTLDDMKRAISSFVQSRKRQRSLYGNSAVMAEKIDMPEVQGNDEALMERVVQSVNRHLGDSDFSVEQLCEEAAISRAHLHRKMKEMTGLAVTEFIRNIRMEQAARLLREQKLNITQVAYTVGFSNLGYFSTIFRKHFGVSPRNFVAEQKEEGEGIED